MNNICEIKLLPTKKPSHLYIQSGKLCYDEHIVQSIVDCNDQHLYVLSNDEIKGGDWIYADGGTWNGTITQCAEVPVTECWKKIIATTDELLTCNGVKREGESCTKNNNCKYPSCKIHSIKKDFIKEFINNFNQKTLITKVSLMKEDLKFVNLKSEEIEIL
jgi:hypothetical protein